MLTDCGVDSDIPKTAHIALFLFAADEGIRPGMANCLLCETIDILSAPSESLGVPQYCSSFSDADIAAFDSHRSYKSYRSYRTYRYGSSFRIIFAFAPVISSQRRLRRFFFPVSRALK